MRVTLESIYDKTSPLKVRSRQCKKSGKKDDKRAARRFSQDEAGGYVAFLRENKWIQKMEEAPTYFPSMEDFKDPAAYIRSIEPEARKYGICKIVPPEELRKDIHMFNDSRRKAFQFTVRSQKMKEHSWSDFAQDTDILYDVEGLTSMEQFRKHAKGISNDHLGCDSALPPTFVESEYWRQRTTGAGRPFYVEYGNDVEGSAFMNRGPLSSTRWNLQTFGKDDGSVLKHLVGELPGITSPMLYIGAAFATFFWHVEDHFMHSINYMHAGASKTWYGIPGDSAEAFEKVVMDKVYKQALINAKKEGYSNEEVYGIGLRNLMKKTTFFSPKHLESAGVPCYRVRQHPGDFVVTFPRSYHGGFSHGFNIGEAVNFGLKDWFDMAEKSVQRYCWLRMQQILPHEELLVKEAVSVGCKYRNGGDPPPEDLGLMKHFAGFMREQRLIRKYLLAKGLKPHVIDSANVSHSCISCGRKSFVSHIITPGAHDIVCIQCAKQDPRLCADGWLAVKQIAAELEGLEGLFRRDFLHDQSDDGQFEMCDAAACSSGASPSSASTSVQADVDNNWGSRVSALRVSDDRHLIISGNRFRRRVVSEWGPASRTFILAEEMLKAMGAPVDEPEDVDHVLGSICHAVRQDPKLAGCLGSSNPVRVQFLNGSERIQEGVLLGVQEVQGILSVVDGEVREQLVAYVQGLWQHVDNR